MTRNVFISRTSAYLPNNPVNNEQIENVLGKVNNRPSRARRIVLANNGIKERFYAIDPVTRNITHSNAELAALAIQQMLSPEELKSIELLACGTSLPDQFLPSHGSMVHGLLKNPPCEVVSTTGVCCSAMAALKYSYMSILSQMTENAVVAGSELVSRYLKSEFFEKEAEDVEEKLKARPSVAFEQDFLRWMLSDGAGAFYLSSVPMGEGPILKIDFMESVSYANELPVCMWAGGKRSESGEMTSWRNFSGQEALQNQVLNIAQDTKLLDEHIVNFMVEKAFNRIRKKISWQPGDVNWFIPHYSSEYFRQSLYERFMKIDFPVPFEKWHTCLTNKGNIGTASIFVYLDDLVKSQKLKAQDRILCFIPESSRFMAYYVGLSVVRS